MAADGHAPAPLPYTTSGTPAPAPAGRWQFPNIFRCFQVALDPRKLFVAAAGILVVSFGWWLLSVTFMGGWAKPIKGEDFSSKRLEDAGFKPPQPSPTDDEKRAYYEAESDRQYARAVSRWKVMDELAGPGGKIRTLPWNEYRGENPYLFATALSGQPSATWGGRILHYLSEQVPVLAEPLQKLLLPVLRMADPNASTYTRIYLILCLLWSVACWAFFGGVITRLAAVQFNGKERTTLGQAVRFVASRYISYVLSPTVPLLVVAVIVLLMAVYGLVALIPWVGDVLLYGVLFPLIVLGGAAIAVILLGLIGYPLMYSTISTEGSDTFDAISRSYNYVFQAPWSFLWYSLVAVVYGVAVSFVVILVGCVMIHLGKGAVGLPASATFESRKPDYLFVYAPESLGWKELFLRGTPAEVSYRPVLDGEDERKAGLPTRPADEVRYAYQPTKPAESKRFHDDMDWAKQTGAGIAAFWMVLVFLLMIGFTYSFFWTAATMVYLLMRKKVDDVDLDEVYVEDVPPAPPSPPAGPTVPLSPAPPGGVSLPTVPPPAVPPTTTTTTTIFTTASPPPAVPPAVPSPPPVITTPPLPTSETEVGTHTPPPPPATTPADW